jgi:hypothetical protein
MKLAWVWQQFLLEECEKDGLWNGQNHLATKD